MKKQCEGRHECQLFEGGIDEEGNFCRLGCKEIKPDYRINNFLNYPMNVYKIRDTYEDNHVAINYIIAPSADIAAAWWFENCNIYRPSDRDKAYY